ncbi:mechanosensitive ion channel family protein [Rubrivivax albus]|uniref:Mechanosensitive ion channel n=1 Tax=Rubrivivax albus TaxID=2499835 RepID=A0A3S2TQW6_9BURK|nr:mechanosensitive ion channel domain-containing protein [Rubrivivax albus]RVT51484.1 mechanosensitive ion channel [Rubrivivax albus]
MNLDLSTVTRWLQQPLFKVGETPVTPVTLASLALAVVLVLAIWWLAGALERLLLRAARRGAGAHADNPAHLARLHMVSRLARYTVWVLGTIVVLNYVGLDLSSVALVGGALAFGLGFGLQNVFSNFISGIIILLEGGLRVGDFVDLESGVRGHVREIAMRYTRVTTNDAIDVLVPNSEFINGRVINWTFDATYRRMRVPFGVAYGTPKEKVREAAIAAARTVEGVLDDAGHEPTAWLVSYGDSAVNYELVVWADRRLTTSPAGTHARLMWALDDALAERGIEIPFPQRDLHVKSGAIDVRLTNA